MPNLPVDRAAPVVTGLGVATGFGYGKECLLDGLFGTRNLFAPLQRLGRQPREANAPFIGIELPDPPEILIKRVARTTGLAGRVAVAVVQEAWTEAGFDRLDPTRVGLVLGGSNLLSREMLLGQHELARRGFVSPHLGYTFFDTDIAALCAATFGIRGVTLSVGGASASGALAVIEAAEMVWNGRLDACIAVGALQDLSVLELEALRAMGALRPSEASAPACRPFDRARDGFVFGESCAAIAIRRSDAVASTETYGRIAGYAHIADGHRGPDPSLEGELRAIRAALEAAGLAPDQIDYVNAHGTGTPLGDDTEVMAYREAGLAGAFINATKSIIGHGIASAGAIEVAVTLMQMRAGRLHPTHDLEHPIDAGLRWIKDKPLDQKVQTALSLSFGFGGINTAIVLTAPDPAGA